MADVSNGFKADDSQLRARPSAQPLHLNNADDAKQKVLELNDQEDKHRKHDSKKRTYGRTPDGTGMSRFVRYQAKLTPTRNHEY
jgi:phosphatidylethanolamine N-methyltransferase